MTATEAGQLSGDRIQGRFSLRKGDFTLESEFSVPGTGATAVFGRSGCGKTTLLRSIAGLEPASEGHLSVNGRVWQSAEKCLPVHRRKVGYVFQEPGLFPHLSVRRNLDYGYSRVADGHHFDIDEAVNLLGIRHLIDRDPGTLSGGERQRVAIARALLSSPDLLLMDEPLAALDVRSRDEILPFLERLPGALRIPMLYVSHSPDEVAFLADYLLLMEEGRVAAQGTLSEVLAQVDSPLARSEDAFSVLRCTVVTREAEFHLSELRSHGGELLRVPRLLREQGPGSGQAVRLRIQARDVSVCLHRPEASSILNILPARLVEMSLPNATGQQLLKLDIGGETLLARVSELSCNQLGLAPGAQVYAQIKAAALLV